MAVSKTRIAPMLAVRDAARAIDFYKQAFGAVESWRIDAGGSIVAGMTIDGAEFFLAEESPPHGTRSPVAVGATTVRIELFVADPVAVLARAVAAGATDSAPVREHRYEMTGPHPIKRMLQGHVIDPSGHKWLIGRIEM
jgi:PhnB protein